MFLFPLKDLDRNLRIALSLRKWEAIRRTNIKFGIKILHLNLSLTATLCFNISMKGLGLNIFLRSYNVNSRKLLNLFFYTGFIQVF